MRCIPVQTAMEKGVFPCMCVSVCACMIRGMLQRFKVPITAECSSNGISGTRRAQMAPKSSESLWKGRTKYRRATYSPTHSLLLTDSSGWFLARAFSPSSILWMLHNHSFQVCNREQNRNAFKMSNAGRPDSLSLMRSWQRLNSIRSLWRFRGKQILSQLFCYNV